MPADYGRVTIGDMRELEELEIPDSAIEARLVDLKKDVPWSEQELTVIAVRFLISTVKKLKEYGAVVTW